MTDQVSDLAQRCYDLARDTDRPTREVARELLAEASPSLVAALAVEFLVSAVADAQRLVALEVERSASVSRSQQSHETVGRPRKGSKQWDRWVQETEEGREWAQREWEAEARFIQMQNGVIRKALDRYAEDLRVQWTSELLDSTFALRSGAVVTWGDATVEQHVERMDIFLKNAHANMEGAARHEIAIRELRESGAPSLREMVGQAALTP